MPEEEINRVFIGRVSVGVSKEQLEDFVINELKDEAGIDIKLKEAWVARDPPGFAFIELYSREDTENCIKYLNGKEGCSGGIT